MSIDWVAKAKKSQPRHPAGTPGGKGGEFAPTSGRSQSSTTDSRVQGSIIPDSMMRDGSDSSAPRERRQAYFDALRIEQEANSFRFKGNVTGKKFVDDLWNSGHRVKRSGPRTSLVGDGVYHLKESPVIQYALLREKLDKVKKEWIEKFAQNQPRHPAGAPAGKGGEFASKGVKRISRSLTHDDGDFAQHNYKFATDAGVIDVAIWHTRSEPDVIQVQWVGKENYSGNKDNLTLGSATTRRIFRDILPDFPEAKRAKFTRMKSDDSGRVSYRDEEMTIRKDWLAKANKKRYPAGTPGGKGGEFAPKEAWGQVSSDYDYPDLNDLKSRISYDPRRYYEMRFKDLDGVTERREKVHIIGQNPANDMLRANYTSAFGTRWVSRSDLRPLNEWMNDPATGKPYKGKLVKNWLAPREKPVMIPEYEALLADLDAIAKYVPSQPRHPAGSSLGGQFASRRGGSAKDYRKRGGVDGWDYHEEGSVLGIQYTLRSRTGDLDKMYEQDFGDDPRKLVRDIGVAVKSTIDTDSVQVDIRNTGDGWSVGIVAVKNGDEIVDGQRFIYPKDKIAVHDRLHIDSKLRGRGTSTALFNAMLPTYAAAGVTKIETFAVSSGSHVWAKLGWKSDVETWRGSVLPEAEARARRMGVYDEFPKVDRNNPRDIRKVAESKYGYELLRSNSWEGVLDLTDDDSMSYFHSKGIRAPIRVRGKFKKNWIEKFARNQPRHPAGSSRGGEFAATSGSRQDWTAQDTRIWQTYSLSGERRKARRVLERTKEGGDLHKFHPLSRSKADKVVVYRGQDSKKSPDGRIGSWTTDPAIAAKFGHHIFAAELTRKDAAMYLNYLPDHSYYLAREKEVITAPRKSKLVVSYDPYSDTPSPAEQRRTIRRAVKSGKYSRQRYVNGRLDWVNKNLTPDSVHQPNAGGKTKKKKKKDWLTNASQAIIVADPNKD